MPGKAPWRLGLAIALGLTLTLYATLAIGQRAMSAEASAPADCDPATTVGPVDFFAVVQQFEGPLQESGAYLAEFTQHFNEQGLQEVLNGFRPTSIVILSDEPADSEAYGYVGLTVPRELQVEPPLELQHVRFPEAVTHKHQGPYEELEAAYRAIEAAAGGPEGPASWPVVLRLLEDPRTVAVPTTELVVPLEP